MWPRRGESGGSSARDGRERARGAASTDSKYNARLGRRAPTPVGEAASSRRVRNRDDASSRARCKRAGVSDSRACLVKEDTSVRRSRSAARRSAISASSSDEATAMVRMNRPRRRARARAALLDFESLDELAK